MDLVTKSLLDSFMKEEGFPERLDNPILFEHFANYCIVSKDYPNDFEIEDIHIGGGNDLQLDGCAIIVNGNLVNSINEVDDLSNINKYIDTEFILIQTKCGGNFSGKEISDMFFGVRELFNVTPTLPRNESLAEKEKIIRHIYSKSTLFRYGNPRLKLYHVTTGKWTEEEKLVARIDSEIATLEDLNIFHSPRFEPVDARTLQQYFRRARNAFSKTIKFANKVTLPFMGGIKEAYLGYLPAPVYLDLITDEDGNLLRNLFYDNVRDFQGDNSVNIEIELTIRGARKDAFVLLNNGITIVSEDLKQTGDQITLTGFQIVNGCQTSHVLFNNKDFLDENVCIPVKLINAPEANLKNQVIKATNRQTVVKPEELAALTDFQKTLEQYYEAIPEEYRLYYERRSGQYRAVSDLEKIRIISISYQIRAFASMFLDRGHQASRYYGTLHKEIENRIFVDGHSPLGYYISSYALFKIDAALRRHLIDNKYRPFRYHLLGIMRMQESGVDIPAMNSRQFEENCVLLKEILWNDERCLQSIQVACAMLDSILGGNYFRDKAKDSTIQNQAKIHIRSSRK